MMIAYYNRHRLVLCELKSKIAVILQFIEYQNSVCVDLGDIPKNSIVDKA
jgi:hypothetical protein